MDFQKSKNKLRSCRFKRYSLLDQHIVVFVERREFSTSVILVKILIALRSNILLFLEANNNCDKTMYIILGEN